MIFGMFLYDLWHVCQLEVTSSAHEPLCRTPNSSTMSPSELWIMGCDHCPHTSHYTVAVRTLVCCTDFFWPCVPEKIRAQQNPSLALLQKPFLKRKEKYISPPLNFNFFYKAYRSLVILIDLLL